MPVANLPALLRLAMRTIQPHCASKAWPIINRVTMNSTASLQKSTAKMQDLPGYYVTGLTYYQLKQYEQAVSSFQKPSILPPITNSRG